MLDLPTPNYVYIKDHRTFTYEVGDFIYDVENQAVWRLITQTPTHCTISLITENVKNGSLMDEYKQDNDEFDELIQSQQYKIIEEFELSILKFKDKS